MPNDPFTLDLFGSSSLSAGLGLGVTAFTDFAPDAANDDDPDPSTPSPAPIVVSPPKTRRTNARANFFLDGDRGLASSWKDRARANVAAILMADRLAKQGRAANRRVDIRLVPEEGPCLLPVAAPGRNPESQAATFEK